MESTGVYWIPLFELLAERGFEVALVDGRKVKHVSGRKSDPIDCRWLRRLHSCGLLQGAFRPTQQVCELRAIVAGERDPAVLARHRDPRCQHSTAEITRALTGTWRPEHLYVLAQALESYDHFQRQIRACDTEIERQLAQWPSRTTAAAPPARPRKRQRNTPQIDLHPTTFRLLGVDVTGMPGMDPYTVLRIVAEVGPTLQRFDSVKAFTAWLGLCPGTRISGGKVLAGKTARTANRAARAFRLAAQSVGKTDTALGAFYRRLRARLGAPKALTATAHKMARQFYALLKHGQTYVERGASEYEARYQQRILHHLSRRARALGFSLVPTPT
jgi:transposase